MAAAWKARRAPPSPVVHTHAKLWYKFFLYVGQNLNKEIKFIRDLMSNWNHQRSPGATKDDALLRNSHGHDMTLLSLHETCDCFMHLWAFKNCNLLGMHMDANVRTRSQKMVCSLLLHRGTAWLLRYQCVRRTNVIISCNLIGHPLSACHFKLGD